MALALVVVLSASVASASAQSAARKKAEDVLRQGIKAQSRRDHNAAVALLTEAVNSGALTRSELGLALYRRAISYRVQKQPALAISDLNSALFFNDALPPKERAEAIELRLKSYRDAGLQASALATSTPRALNSASIQAPSGPVTSGPRIVNTAPPRVNAPVRRVEPRRSLSNLPPSAPILGSSQAVTAPVAPPSTQSASIPAFTTQTLPGVQPSTQAPSPTITTRTSVPTAVASVRSRPANVPTAAWSTATRRVEPGSAARAPAPVATRPVATPAETASRFTPPRTTAPTVWRNPEVARSTSPATSATASSQPPASYQSGLPVSRATGTAAGAERSANSASSSSGVSAGAAAAGVGGFLSSLFGQSTASDQDVPRTTSSVPQSAATTARETAGERVAVVSPPATAMPAARPVEKPAKGFDIEITALHDRYRAEAVAKQIMVQYSSDFYWSSRKTRVEERPGPDGATLYAVRLGHYDDESSARSFCKKLEVGGFDCELVVRR